ncbi:LLM class flavin-dependent oxidoreductase [Ureibacillus sp. FSL K6-8385]|uniref:LLM class flavin-dependent oxidoreductase n=1 Tax=Ureibacillus terrenus TaxID=118246 RepID=A0A540V6A1_9BACL|nr:LLM class flavin-dependent oxidoreductase [Ureibacillus terrenus]MED3660764.1 LLM class flavin-dependent oxidoreductase [Ureibacillus terrenus]MED3762952.1 LLM class flavin-dependent oxidoreductase [Ureibacillus terrenus]TQE92248.1 LLM class flavin-dependent oxidoreductase [Ureibacillus terrenus]
MHPKLSVLDLAPVLEGETPADAFRHSRDLIQAAEKFGYHRYWVAEHHNMEGIASSATSVLICYLAGATKKIRVGAGGIMLPNHAPLIIAEQFGTLESMYPGRIDLGLGRAPGTDLLTARALRRDEAGAYQFDQLVDELMSYFDDQDRAVIAVPGKGLNIPIWLLGSSLYSARLAGVLGLPFAFASHFATDLLDDALDTYHRNFRPSNSLKTPYAMVGINVFVGDTDEEGEFLATTLYQQFLRMIRGKRGKTPPPTNMEKLWTDDEKKQVLQTLKFTFAGNKETVFRQISEFLSQRSRPVNELIINSPIYDQGKRRHSFELLAKIFRESPDDLS